MRVHTWSWALLSVCLNVACKKQNLNQSSPQHTAGQISASGFKSHWHDTDVMKFLSRENTTAIEHPVVQRLQAWAEAMDEAARSSDWGKKHMVGKTPKPKVLVIDSDDVNAFASGTCVKYPAKVTVQGQREIHPMECARLEKNTIIPLQNVDECQIGNANLLGDVIARESHFQKQLGLNCRPVLSQSGRVEFEGCEASYESFQASAYCTKQTTNMIVVHKGLIKAMSEEEVVSVLAHELGHYYKSHPTSFREGYFFWEKKLTQPIRPEPISDPKLTEKIRMTIENLEKTESFLEISMNIYEFQTFKALFEQKIYLSLEHQNSPLYQELKATSQYNTIPFSTLASKKCKLHHPAKNDCLSFEKTIAETGINNALQQGTVTQEMILAVEKRFAPIAKSIMISTDLSRSQWGLESKTFTASDLIAFYSILREKQKLYLNGAKENGLEQVTLDQYLRAVGDSINALREISEKNITQFQQQGIGWYTLEQEADEVAPELLALIGLEPEVQISSSLKLLSTISHESSARGFKLPGLSFEKCKDLADRRFGYGTNSVTTVALSDWIDEHHDQCYRVFNSVREIFLHKYTVNASKRPRFSESWEELVKTLPATSAQLKAPSKAGTPVQSSWHRRIFH